MSTFPFHVDAVEVRLFARTDPGRRRSQNQDAFIVADLGSEDEPAPRFLLDSFSDGEPLGGGQLELSSKGLLALVADGMGGAAAGAVASRMAVNCIYNELLTKWSVQRLTTPDEFALRLRSAVEEASQRIHEESNRQPAYEGMGTTATLAGIFDTFLYLAQVGDSRAYLIRDGQAFQLTRDQSIVQELIDSGSMTQDSAAKSGFGNVILQALGTTPEVEVDVTYLELRWGDVIVLCSDGLTRVVTDDEIAEAVATYENLETCCNGLVELANERGGPDNITLIVLQLEGARLADPTPEDLPARKAYPFAHGAES